MRSWVGRGREPRLKPLHLTAIYDMGPDAGDVEDELPSFDASAINVQRRAVA